jgi:hypothetical protein
LAPIRRDTFTRSRRRYRIDEPWSRWKPGCDVVLAVETTRVKPRLVRLTPGGPDAIPRDQEQFVIHIGRPDPPGAQPGPPHVSNYVDKKTPLPHALLPFPILQEGKDEQREALSLVKQLLLASSAFPLAFPAEKLRHCLTTDATDPSAAPGTECERHAVSEDVFFMDGGVFDNTPVGLAVETARSGLDPSTGQWSPQPVSGSHSDADVAYLYLDADNTAFVPRPDLDQSGQQQSVLGYAGSLLGGLVDTARKNELYATLDRYPDLTKKKQLTLSLRHLPLASDFLSAFFGFFDERFRHFDFVAGEYDLAGLALAGQTGQAGPPSAAERICPPFPAMRNPAARGDEALLRCMAEALGPDAGPSSCDSVADRSLVALVQASIDELYSECACAAAVSQFDTLCRRIAGDAETGALKAPPLLRDDFAPHPADWRRACDGDRFAYRLDLLDRYGFAVAGAPKAKPQVRATLGALIGDLAKRQPSVQGWVLTTAGRLGLDSTLGYMHPAVSLRAVSGRGTEVGASLHVHKGFRVSLSDQLKGWEEVADTPLIGVEYEWPLLSYLQVYPTVRGGYQIGGSGPADVTGGPSSCGRDASACFIKQVGLGLGLFDLLRFQSFYEWSTLQATPFDRHLLLEVGVQYNFPSGPWPRGP